MSDLLENIIKILIVDDEEEIRHSIRRYLTFTPEFQHVAILLAASFDEAVQLIDQNKPHIVLQDINLPDGNGLQLIRQIRKVHPIIQFIIITGASDLDRVMEAISLGATDYIKKPLDLDKLHLIIQQTADRIIRWKELFYEEYNAEGGTIHN